MAYSTLKRKTPLKAKTPLRTKSGFKPSCGFRKKPVGQIHDNGGEKATEGGKTAKKAVRSVRSSLTTHLDIVFSLYIRLRDAMAGGRCRCISCGRVFPFEQIQCGHYHSRRSMATRWDEDNCSAQCCECNCDKSGNIEAYTPALIKKIGQERFDMLNMTAHSMRKWSGDELRDMIAHYTAEVRRLSKEKGIKVKI